jgi:hypothetical protein
MALQDALACDFANQQLHNSRYNLVAVRQRGKKGRCDMLDEYALKPITPYPTLG